MSNRSKNVINTCASRQAEDPWISNSNWIETVRARIKRKNKVLFRLDDAILSDISAMLNSSSRKAIVLWAFELAEEGIDTLEFRCPQDDRARKSLELSKRWARGDIKMPTAKSAILNCHGAAKDTKNEVCVALFHAVGQACSCVHTSDHALGFPIYELTAIVRELGIESCEDAIIERISEYESFLIKAQKEALSHPGPWASFLQ